MTHQHVFDFDLVLSLDHEVIRAARLHRAQHDHPFAVFGYGVRLLSAESYRNRFSFIRPSPHGNLRSLLQDHIVGEERGQSDLRLDRSGCKHEGSEKRGTSTMEFHGRNWSKTFHGLQGKMHPDCEIRSPTEARNPNADEDHAGTKGDWGQDTKNNGLASGLDPCGCLAVLNPKDLPLIRSSEFGFLSGFGLRHSDLYYHPRFALQSKTAPTAWKMKFGSHTIRYGTNSGLVSSAFPSNTKL